MYGHCVFQCVEPVPVKAGDSVGVFFPSRSSACLLLSFILNGGPPGHSIVTGEQVEGLPLITLGLGKSPTAYIHKTYVFIISSWSIHTTFFPKHGPFLSRVNGITNLEVGAGRRQSSHKSKEQVNKTRHDLCLSLQPVAVESGVFCPAVAQPCQPQAGGGECSQLRMVEGKLRRLGTRLLDEETLLSLRTTIAAYVM